APRIPEVDDADAGRDPPAVHVTRASELAAYQSARRQAVVDVGASDDILRLAPRGATVEHDAGAELHAHVRPSHPTLRRHFRRVVFRAFDTAVHLRQRTQHDIGADHGARTEIQNADIAVTRARIEAGRSVVLHASFQPEIDVAGLRDLVALGRRGDLRNAH